MTQKSLSGVKVKTGWKRRASNAVEVAVTTTIQGAGGSSATRKNWSGLQHNTTLRQSTGKGKEAGNSEGGASQQDEWNELSRSLNKMGVSSRAQSFIA